VTQAVIWDRDFLSQCGEPLWGHVSGRWGAVVKISFHLLGRILARVAQSAPYPSYILVASTPTRIREYYSIVDRIKIFKNLL